MLTTLSPSWLAVLFGGECKGAANVKKHLSPTKIVVVLRVGGKTNIMIAKTKEKDGNDGKDFAIQSKMQQVE